VTYQLLNISKTKNGNSLLPDKNEKGGLSRQFQLK